MDSAKALPEGRTADGAAVSQLSMYDGRFGKFARVARGGGAWRRLCTMYDLNASVPEARGSGRQR